MSWDLLEEDFANLDDWTDDDYAGGVSEIDPAGQLHQVSGNSGGLPRIYQDTGDLSGDYTFEFKIRFDTITTSATDWLRIVVAGDTNQTLIHFDYNQMKIYDGASYNQAISQTWATDGTWYTIRVVVHNSQTDADVYLDGELQTSDVDCSYSGGTEGQVYIATNPSLNKNTEDHFDYFYLGSGQQTPVVEKSIEETSTGNETTSILSTLNQSDTGSGSLTESILSQISDSETGTGADTLSQILAQISLSEGASDWLTGWSYRKKINLTGQTGAGTDYQVKLLIINSGGPLGPDFDLEGNSANFPAEKNDGGDLRFTADDGTTELDFWVEEVESDIATVWVEVADDLGTNQSIYCYYGNSDASNGSSGEDTFAFWEVFNDDLSAWTAQHPSVSTIDSDKGNPKPSLKQVEGSGLVYNETRIETTSFSISDCVVNYDVYFYGSNRKIGQFGVRADGTTSGYAFRLQTNSSDGGWFEYNNGWSQISSSYGAVSTETWYSVELRVEGENLSAYVDGSPAVSVTDSTKTTAGHIHCHFHGVSLDSSDYILYDNIRVRKYVATEPSFSSVDNQETGFTYTETISEIKAILTQSDTSSAVDALSSILGKIISSDTGSGTMIISSLVALLSQLDSGIAGEVLSLLVSLTESDTTSGSEIISILSKLTETDSGSGAETISLLATLLLSDSSSSNEAILGLYTKILEETSTSNETLSLIAQILQSDTSSSQEIINELKSILNITDENLPNRSIF
jgi:hypothetical protein